MKLKVHIILLLTVAVLCGCNNASKPGKANFQVSYQPMLDGILYPSLILGYNNYTGNDQFDFFQARLTPHVDNAVMRIVIDSSAINYETEILETLGKRGTEVSFAINP